MSRTKIGLALVGLVAFVGCNDGSVGASSSSTEAQVSGQVTILGKPATDGEVVFDPVNINRRDAVLRRAPIGPDGRYKITTLIGENMALVEGPAIIKNGLAVSNRTPVEVVAGENVIDLAVPRNSGSTGAPARKPGGSR